MIEEAIQHLSSNEDLTERMSQMVMDEILEGRVPEELTATYLVRLSMKGETVDEIVGAACSLKTHFTSPFRDMHALELTGTGGDGLNTFNISTCTAFVLAAAGIPVIKHGNRAATSKTGSADVLESLGINISHSLQNSKAILEETGMCFLYNENFPSPMQQLASVRRKLGIVTILNKIRWLNTAGSDMELLGVYDANLMEPLARALVKMKVRRAMVVHGLDGMDEISLCADTLVYEINNGQISSYRIVPEELGMTRHHLSELAGNTPEENAHTIRQILCGSEVGGKRCVVMLNAAAGIRLAISRIPWKEALKIAQKAIDTGKAIETLERFIVVSGSS